MNEILLLLQQDFFYLTLLQICSFLIVAVPVGQLLVHKNLGLFSDALSHSLIPGLAGAVYFWGLHTQVLSLGALFWGLIVSLLFSLLGGISSQKRDSFLVIISLLGISGGLILNQFLDLKIDFTHMLFGSPLLSTLEDVVRSSFLNLMILIILFINWPKLLLFSIDSEFARIKYGNFKINFIFTLMTTLLVISGFELFGVFLTTGLLILPVLLFSSKHRTLPQQRLYSTGLTILLAFITLIASYSLNLTFSSTFIFCLSALTLIKMILKESSKR